MDEKKNKKEEDEIKIERMGSRSQRGRRDRGGGVGMHPSLDINVVYKGSTRSVEPMTRHRNLAQVKVACRFHILPVQYKYNMTPTRHPKQENKCKEASIAETSC